MWVSTSMVKLIGMVALVGSKALTKFELLVEASWGKTRGT